MSNLEDKLDAFFGWEQDLPDPELSLASFLPSVEPTRHWWKQMFGITQGLVIEEMDGESLTAIFKNVVEANSRPGLGCIIYIDWYEHYGKEGAAALYETCKQKLILLGLV